MLRPNTICPTVAAKVLATLGQLSKGRVVVHFIAGGTNDEQAKEGDFLNKEQRYDCEEEYIRILRLAWTSTEPFDFEGRYYQFKQFVSHVPSIKETKEQIERVHAEAKRAGRTDYPYIWVTIRPMGANKRAYLN